MIVVHVTHEAVEKIGGIGAVLAGLMTAEAYAKIVSRTILLGLCSSLRVLLVCHCYRIGGDIIRLISARKADRQDNPRADAGACGDGAAAHHRRFRSRDSEQL